MATTNYEKQQPVQQDAFISETSSDADARELAALGKKSVLRRTFSPLAILGLSCSLTITWEGAFSVFIFGLLNGGPAGLLYGFLFCWLGWSAVVAVMGELVSMWPTAGGQYHWVYMLASILEDDMDNGSNGHGRVEGGDNKRKKWAPFLSYITGWQSVIAWQALTASGSYLTATAIQGLVVNTQSDYHFERWHGTLMVFALLLICFLFNTFCCRLFPHVETAVLFLHITLFIVVLVVIAVMAPVKSANSDVWALWLNQGGYESKGLSFFVGLITPVFAFSGADGAVHMSEEIRGSSRVVPWALSMSILINGITGFAMMIAILYCIGDIDAALSTPTGYPFIEIFTQAVGSSGGGTALSALLVVMFSFATLGIMASTSRQLWAFARDNAVPNARIVSYVHPSLKVPSVSIAITAVISCLLALINIGSATVFNAIVSLTVAGFFGSYLIPFSLLFYTRIRHPGRLVPGPWTLGKFGVWVNGFAILWSILVMFFSFWPSSVPVTAVNMNWSCVLYVAVVLFAGGFWVVHGRKVYHGPVIETEGVTEADAMRIR